MLGPPSSAPACRSRSDRSWTGVEILPLLPDFAFPGIEVFVWADPRPTHAPLGLRNMAALLAVAESHVLGAPVRVADVASGSIHAYQDPIDVALGLLLPPNPTSEAGTGSPLSAEQSPLQRGAEWVAP